MTRQRRAATPLEEVDAPAVPTQTAPRGIRFDFNDGCRVLVPDAGHDWRVRLTDRDTGNLLCDSTLRAGLVTSVKHYYARIGLEVWAEGEHAPVFSHDYDAAGRSVLIQFPAGTLGDTIAWFPAAELFGARHDCRLTVTVRERFIPLFAPAYPDIVCTTAANVADGDFYATYRVMLYFNDVTHAHMPVDYQLIGLHQAAASLLGLELGETPPRLAAIDTNRPIAEPYVCIAVQSTAQCKYWNNPHGWREVVGELKRAGYRVVCIDQKPVHGRDLCWNAIPQGAEDETGDRPLMERLRWLKHASCFIGLSSGLSWLAWAAGTPVVLISGFTNPLTEFATPYRVINHHACNGCWNDVRLRFDHQDFFWCPRHKDTPRQFECTRLITSAQVLATVRRVPGLENVRGSAVSTPATSRLPLDPQS